MPGLVLVLQVVFWTSLSGLAYAYLVFPALLALCVRLFGRPVRKDDSFLPTVGVLVPAHNEEGVIERKLHNVLALDYPADRLSVWVGLDQCTDRTEPIVRSSQDPRLHIWVSPNRCGKTGVLNHLIPQVASEIVLLTDADTTNPPDSLRRMLRSYADKTVGAVTGNLRLRGTGTHMAEETSYRSFESWLKLLESQLHSAVSASGPFYSLRRSLFRPIPPDSYSNDDVLIPMNVVRQGYRVIYEPEAASEENTRADMREQCTRRIRVGAGNCQSFFRLLDFLLPARGWPWFCYVSHKVSRWSSPFFMLAALVSGAFLCALAPTVPVAAVFSLGVLLILAALSSLVIPWRPTRSLCYFLGMSAALIVGSLQYFRGIKSAAWSPPRTKPATGGP